MSPSGVKAVTSYATGVVDSLRGCSSTGIFSMILCGRGGNVSVCRGYVFVMSGAGYTAGGLSFLGGVEVLRSLGGRVGPSVSVSALLSMGALGILATVKRAAVKVFRTPLTRAHGIDFGGCVLSGLSCGFVFSGLDGLCTMDRAVERSIIGFAKEGMRLICGVRGVRLVERGSGRPLDDRRGLVFGGPSVLCIKRLCSAGNIEHLVGTFHGIGATDGLILINKSIGKDVPSTCLSLTGRCGLSSQVFFLKCGAGPCGCVTGYSLFILPSCDRKLPNILVRSLSLGGGIVAAGSSVKG